MKYGFLAVVLLATVLLAAFSMATACKPKAPEPPRPNWSILGKWLVADWPATWWAPKGETITITKFNRETGQFTGTFSGGETINGVVYCSNIVFSIYVPNVRPAAEIVSMSGTISNDGTTIRGTWTDNNNSGGYEFDGAAIRIAQNQMACPYWQ